MLEAEAFGVPPEEEARLIREVTAILAASGFSFQLTGITYKSVGVMGDGRTHEYGIVVTPKNLAACDVKIQQPIGTKIVNEVRGVNRTTFEIPLNL